MSCGYLGFTHYVYPGIYQYQDFHHCGLEPDDNIVNYDDEEEVWTCQLVGLAEYAFAHYATHCYAHRALAWRQTRNMFASGSQITRMISSLSELMAYVWTRRSVCPSLR